MVCCGRSKKEKTTTKKPPPMRIERKRWNEHQASQSTPVQERASQMMGKASERCREENVSRMH